MSSFAALMALSASQTKQSEAAVQSAIAERQKKEAAKRKAQEAKEAKEREVEAKLRLKHLEDQKRDQERRQRFEEERRKKEQEAKRKEEEERNALRYGPKASGYPSSSSASRGVGRRRPGSDDDEAGGGSALTREEKRRLRLQRELNFGTNANKRATGGAYKKMGRRLPGGAVDDTTGGGAPSGTAYRSVRERLTREPPALIKLNTNKRDTRTIDEILQDRAKEKAAKTLSGEDARGFDNWFGKQKAKAESIKADSANGISRASSMFSSRSNSPERKPSQESQPRPTAKSHSATPPVPSKTPSMKPISTAALSSSVSRLQVSAPPPFKGTGVHIKSVGGKPADKSLAPNGSSSKPLPTKKMGPSEKGPTRPSAVSGKSSSKLPAAAMKKRQRSGSLSDSPPPKRRPQAAPANSISAEIWKMFGKDRSRYVGQDVYSDDEDMEAGASEVEKEEFYSMRLARKEDELAAEEERRHEEEKRRKRKEKELREKRGY
ncbi:hypothetical protein BDW22DRAFT_1352670 [Trametopsis cervina]|nr:hypothetical protein BDW22DRAFT_1352670 [Trametopsis cervina]